MKIKADFNELVLYVLFSLIMYWTVGISYITYMKDPTMLITTQYLMWLESMPLFNLMSMISFYFAKIMMALLKMKV